MHICIHSCTYTYVFTHFLRIYAFFFVVAVHCSVSQCVAVFCNVSQYVHTPKNLHIFTCTHMHMYCCAASRIHIDICTHSCIHTYKHLYIHMFTYLQIHTCARIRYMRMYKCAASQWGGGASRSGKMEVGHNLVHVHVHVHICKYVCVYIYEYLCMDIPTGARLRSGGARRTKW